LLKKTIKREDRDSVLIAPQLELTKELTMERTKENKGIDAPQKYCGTEVLVVKRKKKTRSLLQSQWGKAKPTHVVKTKDGSKHLLWNSEVKAYQLLYDVKEFVKKQNRFSARISDFARNLFRLTGILPKA